MFKIFCQNLKRKVEKLKQGYLNKMLFTNPTEEIDFIRKIREENLTDHLLFVCKRRIDLRIEDTIATYLRFKSKNDERKINFIISLLNKVSSEEKKVDIERKILSSTIHCCKTFQHVLLLRSLPKIRNSEIINKDIRAEMLDMNKNFLGFRNYSPDVAKSSFLTEIFDKLINDDKKNIERIFLLAYRYGKYEYLDKKIEEYKKEFGSEEWFKSQKYFLFITKNQLEKAKICFERTQKDGGWFKFGYLYSAFLQGEEIKNEDVEKFGIMLGDNEKSWFIIFKIFLLRSGTKEMFSGLDMDEIVEHYVLGYYFFSINKRYRMFKGKELEGLMEKYRKRFKGSLLEQVLKGDVNGEKLAEYFGKNSSFYQFYKLGQTPMSRF